VQTIYDLHGLDRRCPQGSRPKISFEDWLSAYYLHSFWPYTLASFSPASPCPFCSHVCPTRLSLQITRAPAFFFVDVSDWDLETNPFHVLHLQMIDNTRISYRLCGAIYFGVTMGRNIAALFNQMEGWSSPWDVQSFALYALQVIVPFPFSYMPLILGS